MDIVALEEKYHGFYTPAFQILVDKSNLLTAEFFEITQVQVDNTLKGADQFSFTVNSSFDFKNREFQRLRGLFDFGAEVEIMMGYLDKKTMTVLMQGMITSVKTNFPTSGLPQLTVSGYDQSYPLTKNKRSQSWDKEKDSDIVKSIAKEHQLKPIVDDTEESHPKVEQNQESDYQFVEKLAKRNGFECYTQENKLYFQKPASNQKAIVTLEWGKGLVSFSPEMNIAEQVAAVEVRGWNVETKSEIVGIAKKQDEYGRDPQKRSGAEYVEQMFKTPPTLYIRLPVRSKQDADRRAKSILKEKSEQLLTGSGESIGLPEIRANRNLELKGLGELFSKTYYIEQSTHTINNSGYKTTFKVKETTI